MSDRLPWEIVETLPSTDEDTLAAWGRCVEQAPGSGPRRVRALVGRALARYWAVQVGLVDATWQEVHDLRIADVEEALALARRLGDPDTLATALLGSLYALWGPDQEDTDAVVQELLALRDHVEDEELRLRIREWSVIGHFLRGDLAAVDVELAEFAELTEDTDLVLFRRRTELWRANLAMLRGDIDGAVRINQEAISSTARTAGSPFSFQNVAVTLAIERFLRRGLADLVETVRSIRASSPRVGANWDVGLAFTLSEAGQLEEAEDLFDALAAEDFRGIQRDLNWALTMHLVALVALNLGRDDQIPGLLARLEPFADLDTTHGAGYASYGPMGRVVGMLAARRGDTDAALRYFDRVLERFEPGPWTVLTLLERAKAARMDDPERALGDALASEQQMRGHGMHAWADRARDLAVELRLAGGAPVAVLRDGTWTLRHPAGSAELPEGVGVAQLLALLRRPGSLLDAVELDGTGDPTLPRHAAGQQTLDATARTALRDRLRQLESEPGSADARAEADFIRSELAGGSYSPSGSKELERARVRVTKAIRRTITAISEQSPGLAGHLEESVSTGRQCLYAPPDAQGWHVHEP